MRNLFVREHLLKNYREGNQFSGYDALHKVSGVSSKREILDHDSAESSRPSQILSSA